MFRHRKGGFPCFYLSDCATYTLPPELEDLPRNVQVPPTPAHLKGNLKGTALKFQVNFHLHWPCQSHLCCFYSNTRKEHF